MNPPPPPVVVVVVVAAAAAAADMVYFDLQKSTGINNGRIDVLNQQLNLEGGEKG